jgi:hypothetical protein
MWLADTDQSATSLQNLEVLNRIMVYKKGRVVGKLCDTECC